MSQHPSPPPVYARGPVDPPPPPRRRVSGVWLAFAVVCGVFVLLLGVTVAVLASRGDDAAGDGAAPSPDAGSPSPTAPAEEGSAGGGAGTPLEGDVVVDAGTELTWFRSPSGNITCLLSGGTDDAPAAAECAIGSVTWTVEEPADCELDWGGGQDGVGRVSVGGDGEGQVVCAGDALDPGTSEVVDVPYGQAIWLEGELVCRSAETGVRCESLTSGHGFSVSRAALDLY